MKRRRNRKITSTTSTIVPSIVSDTSRSASRTETERSLTSETRTDCGSCDWNFGIAAFTASTTCTVLASGWRRTAREMARSPFKLAKVLTVS